LKSDDSGCEAAASRRVFHTWTIVHQITRTWVCHRDWDHRKLPRHSYWTTYRQSHMLSLDI